MPQPNCKPDDLPNAEEPIPISDNPALCPSENLQLSLVQPLDSLSLSRK